jgi:hypothetical protein
MISRRPVLPLSVLICALIACGGDQESVKTSAPTVAASPAAGAAAPDKGVEEATRDMVAGVTAGKSAGLVELKFKLKSRPEIGQPLTIEVALLPNTAAEVMRATFSATEGLTVGTSEVPAEYQRVQPGSIYRHEVSVVPREHGVYFVSATVMVQTDTGEVFRTFSIPVVIGVPPESEAAAPNP